MKLNERSHQRAAQIALQGTYFPPTKLNRSVKRFMAVYLRKISKGKEAVING